MLFGKLMSAYMIRIERNHDVHGTQTSYLLDFIIKDEGHVQNQKVGRGTTWDVCLAGNSRPDTPKQLFY